MPEETFVDAAKKPFAVHLLDVGLEEYGDAILCQFGDTSVLIDGAHTGDQTGKEGHKSIPDQIGQLLKQPATPYRVSLLIVSHAHEDHIGCLPFLVENKILVADFALVVDPALGWGRSADDAPVAVPADERVRQVVAALREEIRTEGTDDNTLAKFLDAAVTLEDRYKTMLTTLAHNGTKVFRHGRDNPKALKDFLKTKSIGLNILGPSQDQLAACADRIKQTTDDALASLSDFARVDETVDAVTLYRQIVGDGRDAMDAAARPGPAVNLQSIVTSFEFKNKKFLFAGDMQFADPQFSAVKPLVADLRGKVKEAGPYSFVKLSHHGSDNAFNEDIYAELNAKAPNRLFGICAGQNSTVHPNASTLNILQNHKADIQWARTDHNRQSSFFFDTATPKITLEKGKLNDPKPNATDVIVEEPVGEVTEPIPTQETGVTSTKGDVVEITARIPNASTRVTLTIDVKPGGAAGGGKPDIDRSSDALSPLKIAGGRKLPKLLFVTSKDALARNIGQKESDHVLQTLRSQNALLFDQVPKTLTDAGQCAALVRQQLRQNPGVEGVVLLGGYDVVPSQRADCLPADLRSKVSASADADNFIVWSDDIYGDLDGDLLPELPVSRIPDGNRAALVFAAIQAAGAGVGTPRAGVRNIARPFADPIFKTLTGSNQMLVSRPTTFDGPPYSLRGDMIYIMAHGDYTDSSRFWGEETKANREAVNTSNLPQKSGKVVFTGCCWGALTVNTPAGRVVKGRSFGQKSLGDSLAMSFLLRGAIAFVGCTGSHYSPLQLPYKFFGGPMHEAFWQRYQAGASPAQALFDAKLQYLKGMPHGQTASNSQAIEYKILRQYTCLGLGW